jgi:hypothetical protein
MMVTKAVTNGRVTNPGEASKQSMEGYGNGLVISKHVTWSAYKPGTLCMYRVNLCSIADAFAPQTDNL